jgi:phosphate-selective porin OprO/OprP
MSQSQILTVALCAISAAGACSAVGQEVPHKQRPVSVPESNMPIQGGSAARSDEKEKSIYDRLWDYPTIYRNKDSDGLNELRITGRLHLDQYNLDSNLGHDSDWIARRTRIGLKAQLFHNLTAHAELEFDPQNDNPAYLRFTDAYLAWKFSDAVKLTVGKQSTRFTLDGTTSNEMLTIDRNVIANNLWFPLEYIPGVTLSGTVDQWTYNVGVFSGGTASPEFGNFDAGTFVLASLGYDFAKQLGAKKALLRVDYVHNERNPESSFARPLENIGSLVFILDHNQWGFSGELSGGTGYGSQGDMGGFSVLPWYNLTDKLQVVARYTYMKGDEANSIRFNRYESVLTSGRGDEYSELYGGLNYYFYGHKLKLQTGLAYVTMHDSANDGGRYAGWSWTTGLRVSW